MLPGRSQACTVLRLTSGSRTAKDWWEAGQIILTAGDEHDWDRSRRRDFQNDALIALTARARGATVVTANRDDFEILGRKLGVRVLAV